MGAQSHYISHKSTYIHCSTCSSVNKVDNISSKRVKKSLSLEMQEEEKPDPLRNLLIGIGADDFYQLFVEQDITEDLLPFLTINDLREMGIPGARIASIFQSILCLRPIELENMTEAESKLFEEFSLRLTEKESHDLYQNCTEQIRYLTGVVQHIKRQIRGFDGNEGIIENLQEVFEKTPAEMITEQTRQLTDFINSKL